MTQWSTTESGANVATVAQEDCLATITEAMSAFRYCGGMFVIRFNGSKNFAKVEPTFNRKVLVTFGLYDEEYTPEEGNYRMSFWVI